MAPPKPTSIPSQRPAAGPAGKTALSSNTRGLKFMQRGAAAKAAPGAAPPSASPVAPSPAAGAAASPAAPAAASEPPKKTKGWLGVPQAEAESQWVLPGASAGAQDEAWGEVAEEGKLEVEESYLPFVLAGSSSRSGAVGGGKGGRWSYGGLNQEVEKLSAPPPAAAGPSTAFTSTSSAVAAQSSEAPPVQAEASSSKAPVTTEGGFLRPAAFASADDADEEEVAAALGGATSASSSKGKSKATSSASSVPPSATGLKTKYPQGARGSKQTSTVPSSSSYASLSSSSSQQRGKKRPSSDAFDAPRGGGLLSGLELGDADVTSGGAGGGSAFAGGEGQAHGQGRKKGRVMYDNGVRREGGMDAVGRGAKAGGGGGGKGRRK